MFEIGTHVIHPGQGVCTVMGFRDDTPQPTIMLQAKKGHATTMMLYPVAQAERLHATISKDEAEDILANYADLECDDFTERNASLEESYFKQELKKGAPTTVRVAKTMRRRIVEAENKGKKPSTYYTRVMKEARRRSVEEFAVALGISDEEAEERFKAAAEN